jgi:hypothetical protein
MSGKTSLDFVASFLDQFGWAWWVKVTTKEPQCIYFFGPFVTEAEAKKAQPGYIEDLKQEGAVDIIAEVSRMRPDHRHLTIEGNDLNSINGSTPALALAIISSLTSLGLMLWA